MRNVAVGEPTKYDVYFIEDGAKSLGVGLSKIRNCSTNDKHSFWSQTVDKFVGEEFTHDGTGRVRAKGTFRVDKLGNGENVNKYSCTRAAEGKKKQLSRWFEVSKVVMQLKNQREKKREV